MSSIIKIEESKISHDASIISEYLKEKGVQVLITVGHRGVGKSRFLNDATGLEDPPFESGPGGYSLTGNPKTVKVNGVMFHDTPGFTVDPKNSPSLKQFAGMHCVVVLIYQDTRIDEHLHEVSDMIGIDKWDINCYRSIHLKEAAETPFEALLRDISCRRIKTAICPEKGFKPKSVIDNPSAPHGYHHAEQKSKLLASIPKNMTTTQKNKKNKKDNKSNKDTKKKKNVPAPHRTITGQSLARTGLNIPGRTQKKKKKDSVSLDKLVLFDQLSYDMIKAHRKRGEAILELIMHTWNGFVDTYQSQSTDSDFKNAQMKKKIDEDCLTNNSMARYVRDHLKATDSIIRGLYSQHGIDELSDEKVADIFEALLSLALDAWAIESNPVFYQSATALSSILEPYLEIWSSRHK